MKRIAIGAVALLALSGCSAPAQDDNLIDVVASTSVYGDIASTVGGDLVSVISLISESTVDPHSFEASARDQLAISEADLIIENGGGYDPFIDSLIDASGSAAVVISAVDASGLLDHADADDHSDEADHADADGHDHIEGFNEHVWYSLHGMTHVVEAVVEQLSALDATNATTYEQNGAALTVSIEKLEARAEALDVDGVAAVTEPVPVYLLEAAGLDNITPDDFTEAIEEGNDVPPLALQETLALLSEKQVLLLAYNSQTASPETERVRQAAEEAGIPVVEFTETLPEGADYVSWMTANLDALETALGR